MKTSSWTVKRQLVAVLILNLVVVVALAVTGQLGLGSLRDDVETIGLKRVPDMSDFEGLNRFRMAIRAQTMEALALSRDGEADHRDDYARVLKERAAAWVEIERRWESVKARPRMSERGRKLMTEAATHYTAWRAAYVELDGVLAQLARTAPAENATLRARCPGTSRRSSRCRTCSAPASTGCSRTTTPTPPTSSPAPPRAPSASPCSRWSWRWSAGCSRSA
jgi:hypothetical protein